VHGWKVPALDPADVAIYAELLLATHIAQTLKLELLEPEVDWLPSVPERWRNRTVLLSTMKEARAFLEPRFIKSAAGKEFDARIYPSGKDLPRGEMISDSLAVLFRKLSTLMWNIAVSFPTELSGLHPPIGDTVRTLATKKDFGQSANYLKPRNSVPRSSPIPQCACPMRASSMSDSY
jgi:hypothetical protein